MNAKLKSPAPAINEQAELMTFHFSESKNPVRNLLIEQKPWFVAKDVCEILGLSDTNKALQKLDTDEKLTRKIFGSGQNRRMWVINESGLYALILRSNKPFAKSFRKWITSEVIPSILRKGYYGTTKSSKEFVDARDVPYSYAIINECEVRSIVIDNCMWLSVNDINRALRSTTSAHQLVKRLNAKQKLAQKIWLFGNTNPSWFTNQLGMQLMLAGSKTYAGARQLQMGGLS